MKNYKNWIFFYILIPLLPFLISGVVKYITIMGAGIDYTQFNLSEGLLTFIKSWDPIKLTFATAMMSFFIKVDLTNHHRLMDNQDKIDEVSDRCTQLFLFGISSFILIGLLILLQTLITNCELAKLFLLELIFNAIAVFLSVAIIRYGYNIQKEFKLECKNII